MVNALQLHIALRNVWQFDKSQRIRYFDGMDADEQAEMQDRWDHTLEYDRHDPLLRSIADYLEMDGDDIDNLLERAANVETQRVQ